MNMELSLMNNTRVENRGLKENLFHEISSIVKRVPSYPDLGINAIYLSPGMSSLEVVVARPEAGNSLGDIHGGIIAAIADAAMGLTAYALNFRLVTLELNINYLAPVKLGERLTAEGRAIHTGRKTVVAEAGLYNSGKKLVAKSRGTLFITDTIIKY
jgi:acyl-CoA thioesterase